jgi:release factor glutamine methyltransferase
VTTISARIAEGRQRLMSAGIDHDEAALDARLLAEHALGWDTTRLLTNGSENEPDGFGAAYETLLARRARREPLPYITGTREFWNLTLEVSSDVLVPRPETEGLVEEVLQLYADPQAALRIADVCTGSGCIAVALAHERPNARVVATDSSAAALRVAARNVARLGLDDRVELVLGDLLDPLTDTFHVIVANPPYIPASARPALQAEVRDYEPPAALFAGADGLDVIRRLVKGAAAFLKPNGFLIFEFGEGQDGAIRTLISGVNHLKMVAVKTDLQGIPRVAVSRRIDGDGPNIRELP